MNLTPFLDASPVIQIHVVTALGALFLSAGFFIVRRGRLAHRTLGIAFASLMIMVAITAVFIRPAANGGFALSIIHVFVPIVCLALFGVAMGLIRRRPSLHRRSARGLILGALIIPALFTLMPGRLMHEIVFGADNVFPVSSQADTQPGR